MGRSSQHCAGGTGLANAYRVLHLHLYRLAGRGVPEEQQQHGWYLNDWRGCYTDGTASHLHNQCQQLLPCSIR
jgi:hypothetical protein